MMKKSAMDETARTGSLGKTKAKTEGPIIIPAKISPTTEGRRNLSNNSPTRRAAAKTIKTLIMISKGDIRNLPANHNLLRFYLIS